MDRFTVNSKWQKILFKAGKKLQLAEIEEIQSLLLAQNTKAFNYLYSYYSIVKGLNLFKIGQNNTSIIFELEAGQIYLDYKGKGYFIDVNKEVLSLLKNRRNFINLVPKITTLLGDNLKDPLTGGDLFGDIGSNREILNYEIKVNEDGYPIAIVDTFDNNILIYNYFLEDFIKSTDAFKIPKVQREQLENRFFEERGNFTTVGLIPSIKSNKLSISPGIAYLQGRRLNINYPSYIFLNPNLFNSPDLRLHILLKKTGRIYLSKFIDSNTLNLGVIFFNTVRKNYQVIPSNIKAYSEDRIRYFQTLNNKINNSIQELVLSYQSLIFSSNRNIFLKDLFIDSFSSLDYSDTNNLLYNANVDIQNQRLELNYSKLSLKFDNLSNTFNSNFSLFSKNNSYLYLIPSFSESSIFVQRKASSTIKLQSSQLTNIQPFIYATPSVTNKEVVNIIVEGYGFNNQPNLQIKLNGQFIRDIILLEGTSIGASIGSFNSKIDSSIKVKLNNVSLNLDDNLIEVVNNNVTVSTIIKLQNTENISASQNIQEPFNLADKIICQYLNISTPVTITSLDLAVKDFTLSALNNSNNSNNITAALIFLVSIKNGLPSEEVLTKGNLYISDIRKTNNGSVLSSVRFDKPAYINKGLYGIVIYPLLPSLDIYQYVINQPLLNSQNIAPNINTINNGLGRLENGVWQRLNSNLTFDLKRAVPNSSTSNSIFKIDTGIFKFSKLQSFISLNTPPTTNINLSYRLTPTDPWKPFNSDLDLKTETSTLDLKINTENNNNRLPIISSSESTFIVKSYNKLGSWISKTIEFEDNYTNLEVSFDYYLPLGTSLELFFSSNEGRIWEKLTNNFNWKESSTLINNNIPLYKGTLKQLDLSQIIKTISLDGGQQDSLRKKLTLRVDLKTNSAISPYIQKLIASVW